MKSIRFIEQPFLLFDALPSVCEGHIHEVLQITIERCFQHNVTAIRRDPGRTLDPLNLLEP